MTSRITRLPLAAATAACAGLGGLAACGRAEALSTSARFNAETEARAAAAPPHADRASPAFAARFVRVAALRLPVSGTARTAEGGLARRPDLCALAPSGDLYLGRAGGARLHLWPAGAAAARPLPLEPGTAPRKTGALFWHAGEGALYVHDGGRNQVRRYDPSGRLLGLAALNAGQTVFSLAVTAGGTLVAGGVRAEDTERATLVSVHDPRGRHRGAFLEMDPAMARSKVRAAPPVLLSPAGGETFLAAQPTSPEIVALTAEGEVRARFGAPFDGYRPPAPLTDEVIDFARADAWARGWDRMVFLHRGERFVFAAFQGWRGGRARYFVEVYDLEGRRVATGLRHDALPLCGQGDELVLVSQGDPGAAEVSRWRFVPPPEAARAALPIPTQEDA